MDEAQTIIDGLKSRGYSIMLGVPAYWREGGGDVIDKDRLMGFIRQADIIMPWYVGRFNNKNFDGFKQLVADDIAWAKANKIDFAPNCWPGFSWENLFPGADNAIARQNGRFFKDQIDAYIGYGAEMIYFAMFDEVNEGTAIFKVAKEVPVPRPGATFVPIEKECPSDLYLRIAGETSGRLK